MRLGYIPALFLCLLGCAHSSSKIVTVNLSTKSPDWIVLETSSLALSETRDTCIENLNAMTRQASELTGTRQIVKESQVNYLGEQCVANLQTARDALLKASDVVDQGLPESRTATLCAASSTYKSLAQVSGVFISLGIKAPGKVLDTLAYLGPILRANETPYCP